MEKSTPRGEFVKSYLKVQEINSNILKDLDLPEGKTIAELLYEKTETEESQNDQSDKNEQ